MRKRETNTSSSFPELWQTAFLWLIACGAKPNKSYCKNEITTHDDYPSFLSLTDFFDGGGMSYHAVQADLTLIHQFNYPVLAHMKQGGLEYLKLVRRVDEWDYDHAMKSIWTGIAIYPEKKTTWHSKQNQLHRKAELASVLYAIAWSLIALTFYTLASLRYHHVNMMLFGLLGLAGLSIAVLILGIDLGYKNELTRQFCGTVSRGGCEKVLKSKYAKGIAGIGPADVAVIHFSAQFLAYLIGSFYPFILPGAFLLAMGGPILAAWSLYTQGVKLKIWCAMCLAIAGILTLESCLVYDKVVLGQGASIALNVISYFMIAFAFLPVKRLIKQIKLNRIKLQN